MPAQFEWQWYYRSHQSPPLLAELSKGVRTPILPSMMMFGLIDRVYPRSIEANPVLYTATTFDFRSFPAYLLASTLLPAHTFSSICSIHLKYHFGYRLWCGHPDNYYQRPREDPVWNQAWEIMKGMEELRSVVVDLDAYLEDGRVGRKLEREVLGGLGAVRFRGGGEGGFVVRVTWEGDGGEGAEEECGKGTFRLVRVGSGRRKAGGDEVDIPE